MKSVLYAAILLSLVAAVARADEQRGLDFFEQRIRPVLAEQCYGCHSADAARAGKLEGELQLDTRAGIRRGGESGPAVVPGKVDESLLISALRHESFEMPPKGKLPDDVVADFVKWIERGAPDPREGDVVDTGRKQIDVAAGREFWSYRPLATVEVPAVKSAWPRTVIDRFVVEGLQSNELAPVADAVPRSLVRRLYFDLVGLPPSPEEIDGFVRDAERDREAAVASLVDRLLASPRFGERWGRHWLDVARYGETSGGTKNGEWPDAWKYRDYVIAAFNEDRPYDEFVREQIAGDLLPTDDEELRRRRIIATGFLAMGANKSNSERMEIIGEQLDVVGRAVLGTSIGCARCHDHQFDPIPTRDFYALAGIFVNSDPKDQTSHVSRTRHLVELDKQRINAHKDYVGALAKHGGAIQKSWEQIEERLAKRDLRYDVLLTPEENVARLDGKHGQKAREAVEAMRKAEKELDKLRRQGLPDAPLAIAVEETGVRGKFANTRIHVRGNEDVLGEEVPRNTIGVLSETPLEIGEEESGRRQFAELVSRHPLAARVMANRLWHHLFGRGLVRTVDNFGELGERPTHPELLEYLAGRFVESGWSVKALIREIVLSRTYQLSAAESAKAMEVDPDNRWLWRHAPRRRDAESLRDAILFAAGTLDLEPPDAWRQLANHAVGRHRLAQARLRHRAVYLPVMRGEPSDVLAAFNFPPPDLVVGRRETPSVPTQALFLLNSRLVMEQSRHMAARLMDATASDADRLDLAYELILGRLPGDAERARSQGFLAAFAKLREDASTEPDAENSATRINTPEIDAWAALCQALFASAEFRFVN